MSENKDKTNGKGITLPKGTNLDKVMAAAKAAWARRCVNADGTLKHNRFLTIPVRVGEDKQYLVKYDTSGLTCYEAIRTDPVKVSISIE